MEGWRPRPRGAFQERPLKAFGNLTPPPSPQHVLWCRVFGWASLWPLQRGKWTECVCVLLRMCVTCTYFRPVNSRPSGAATSVTMHAERKRKERAGKGRECGPSKPDRTASHRFFRLLEGLFASQSPAKNKANFTQARAPKKRFRQQDRAPSPGRSAPAAKAEGDLRLWRGGGGQCQLELAHYCLWSTWSPSATRDLELLPVSVCISGSGSSEAEGSPSLQASFCPLAAARRPSSLTLSVLSTSSIDSCQDCTGP